GEAEFTDAFVEGVLESIGVIGLTVANGSKVCGLSHIGAGCEFDCFGVGTMRGGSQRGTTTWSWLSMR
ncbi:MAG: hypothetical protein RL215_564, partial [Planctomycetota bacterium]